MSADVTLSCNSCGQAVAELNVTYNLTPMLKAAGFRGWRWVARPTTTVTELAEHLARVSAELRRDSARYQAMNPVNGWGTYPGLLMALEDFTDRAKRFPDSVISTWL